MYDVAPGNPCLQGLLATSEYVGPIVDVVVSDFNDWPPEADHQEGHRYSGAGNAILE